MTVEDFLVIETFNNDTDLTTLIVDPANTGGCPGQLILAVDDDFNFGQGLHACYRNMTTVNKLKHSPLCAARRQRVGGWVGGCGPVLPARSCGNGTFLLLDPQAGARAFYYEATHDVGSIDIDLV